MSLLDAFIDYSEKFEFLNTYKELDLNKYFQLFELNIKTDLFLGLNELFIENFFDNLLLSKINSKYSISLENIDNTDIANFEAYFIAKIFIYSACGNTNLNILLNRYLLFKKFYNVRGIINNFKYNLGYSSVKDHFDSFSNIIICYQNEVSSTNLQNNLEELYNYFNKYYGLVSKDQFTIDLINLKYCYFYKLLVFKLSEYVLEFKNDTSIYLDYNTIQIKLESILQSYNDNHNILPVIFEQSDITKDYTLDTYLEIQLYTEKLNEIQVLFDQFNIVDKGDKINLLNDLLKIFKLFNLNGIYTNPYIRPEIKNDYLNELESISLQVNIDFIIEIFTNIGMNSELDELSEFLIS